MDTYEPEAGPSSDTGSSSDVRVAVEAAGGFSLQNESGGRTYTSCAAVLRELSRCVEGLPTEENAKQLRAAVQRHRAALDELAAGLAEQRSSEAEVASQLLPQLHGWFVCVVAPRHRVRDADLAAELAAALRAALPTTTRVGAPRCMWLLANAKLERTLLCRVNLKS